MTDEDAVQRFEAFVQAQRPAMAPWAPVTDYSFEARKAIEGIHPQLIKDVFRPTVVVDVGCGPTQALSRCLRLLGVTCIAVDREDDYGDSTCDITRPIASDLKGDLVIARELLEHLTVRDLARAVRNLCALSSQFVYGTTRFHPAPSHLLDFTTEFEQDPTHITCGTKVFLRILFALEGFRWRQDLADQMDWRHYGRTFVFERDV